MCCMSAPWAKMWQLKLSFSMQQLSYDGAYPRPPDVFVNDTQKEIRLWECIPSYQLQFVTKNPDWERVFLIHIQMDEKIIFDASSLLAGKSLWKSVFRSELSVRLADIPAHTKSLWKLSYMDARIIVHTPCPISLPQVMQGADDKCCRGQMWPFGEQAGEAATH